MKLKKLAAGLTAGILCLSMLAGCGGGGQQQQDPAGSTGDPGASGKAHPTLNLRITTDITSLDPQVTTANEEYSIFIQIFDGLVKFNGDKFEAIPALATDWTISEDGTEYVFNLREGVKWHDGSDFTSEDVVFTFNRIKEMPATASKCTMISSVEAVDELTVRVVLEYAYPNFILQLCSYPFCIVSKNAVETYGDNNDDMLIGTGAYKFVSNTSGVGVTLEANPDYWGEAPYFETVNYRIIPDNNTALTSLLNGEIDLNTVSTQLDVDYVNDTDGYTVHSFQRNAAYFLAFNEAEAPFDNEYFRKAIAYAINKEEYVSLVWNNQAVACPKATMLSEGEEGYCDEIPSYDYSLEKAQEMLDQSGLSKEEMAFTLTVSTAGYGPTFAAAFQESMNAIGVDVTINSVEAGAHSTAFFAGDYQAIVHTLASVPYNPPLFYTSYLSPTGYIGRNNTLGLEEQAATANRTFDDETRTAMYEDINVAVGEACMYIPIAYQVMNYAAPEQLQGMAWLPSLLTDTVCNWYWEE